MVARDPANPQSTYTLQVRSLYFECAPNANRLANGDTPQSFSGIANTNTLVCAVCLSSHLFWTRAGLPPFGLIFSGRISRDHMGRRPNRSRFFTIHVIRTNLLSEQRIVYAGCPYLTLVTVCVGVVRFRSVGLGGGLIGNWWCPCQRFKRAGKL